MSRNATQTEPAILASMSPDQVADEVLRYVWGLINKSHSRAKTKRTLVVKLFKKLPEADQLRVLKECTDGDSSCLSKKVQIEALDGARQLATEHAAKMTAVAGVLAKKLSKRNRSPDAQTIQLSEQIESRRLK